MAASKVLAFFLLYCFIGVHNSPCPEDSAMTEDGKCKCVSPCPTKKCRLGQRPVQLRAAFPKTPGTCCPLYKCVPSDPVSWVVTEDSLISESCTDSFGMSRMNGERWQEEACTNCVCENGTNSCQTVMCRNCENPVIIPGQCCPHCPSLYNVTAKCVPLNNCELHCDNGYANDNRGCPICQCAANGEVSEEATATIIYGEKMCPGLPHCELDCVLEKDDGGCPVCACHSSHFKAVIPINVATEAQTKSFVQETSGEKDKEMCPELKCDLHCERGLLMDEKDCTVCQCKPRFGCPPLIGCKKKCTSGYKINKKGCPVCRCWATCIDYYNETHLEGTAWKANNCTTCHCDANGRLSCKETICSVACSNPKPPEHGECCPICPITVGKEDQTLHSNLRNWGIVPITLIIVLALLCVLLMIHIVRNKFHGRLSPSSSSFSTYPHQYYKCVAAYDPQVHRNEKIVPL